MLLAEWNIRYGIAGATSHDTAERDFSWLDWGLIRDVTPDGQMILFDETGEGGGPGYSVYVRKADGSPAVRLGRGVGATLSRRPTRPTAVPTGNAAALDVNTRNTPVALRDNRRTGEPCATAA